MAFYSTSRAAGGANPTGRGAKPTLRLLGARVDKTGYEHQVTRDTPRKQIVKGDLFVAFHTVGENLPGLLTITGWVVDWRRWRASATKWRNICGQKSGRELDRCTGGDHNRSRRAGLKRTGIFFL